MDVVEYIKVTAENQNIPYELKIITNGCHSEEQTEYLMQSFSQIIISFDGLPEVKNRNPCFADSEPCIHPWLLPNDKIITDQDVIKNSGVLGQVVDGVVNM